MVASRSLPVLAVEQWFAAWTLGRPYSAVSSARSLPCGQRFSAQAVPQDMHVDEFTLSDGSKVYDVLTSPAA